MDIVEKLARLMAELEGFDPDGTHFNTNIVHGKKIGDAPHEELVDSGKKKWELFTNRAKVHIECWHLIKEWADKAQ